MLINLTGGVKVLSQSNKGAASARNRALEEVTGEYIMFMDCDDLISPHKILKQVEILQENDPYTIVSCEWDTFYSNIEEAVFPKSAFTKIIRIPLICL